ncbi:hypothetical protein IEQ11_19425 [Lysobacter capsici]|nr:hypothetical protein [Lysobacter capsici]UOF13886.1 hypothetical protein IEQ11_19425 [Lysobacter capsici]
MICAPRLADPSRQRAFQLGQFKRLGVTEGKTIIPQKIDDLPIQVEVG